jgi:sugar lactone lactonase YvrE
MIKHTLTIFLLTALSLFAPDAPLPLAGTQGEAAYQDGVGTESRFSDPSGLTRDAQGNLYVCDSRNHVIRKIAVDGIVTTIAGKPGESGAVDGLGAAARFHFPSDVAVAPDGTLYIADTGNHCIRKISITGQVTTLAGDLGSEDDVDFSYGANYKAARSKISGKGKAARFNSPSGIVYAPSGHLFVSDTGNQIIRRVDMKGAVITVAGMVGEWGTTDGAGSKARFNSPMGLCLGSDGAIYIADSMNHCIRRMTLKGQVSTFAGNAKEASQKIGPRLEARFAEPRDIAPHPSGGFIICESLGNSIFRLNAEGNVSLIALPENSLSLPSSAVCDPTGNIFLSNTFHHTVLSMRE